MRCEHNAVPTNVRARILKTMRSTKKKVIAASSRQAFGCGSQSSRCIPSTIQIQCDEVQHVERQHHVTQERTTPVPTRSSYSKEITPVPTRVRGAFLPLCKFSARQSLHKPGYQKMRKLSMLLTMTIPKHRSGFNSCALCLMQTLFDIAPS